MEEKVRSRIQSLLNAAGYPAFETDEDGFPNPGQLIKFYREQMKYILPDGREVSWTQKDLAKVLACSEVSVRLMENSNVSLDSISRRRLLADLLKIPPVLLGLGSLEDLAEFLKHHEVSTPLTPSSSAPAILTGSSVEKETIKLYQDAATVYWEMHYTGTAQDAIVEIEQWVERIGSDAARATERQQRQLEELLCSYHQLAANIYSDQNKFSEAFKHLDTALELATALGSPEQKAAILYRSGHVRLDQRKFTLAKTTLDAALDLSGQISPQLQGAIFQATGLTYALVAQSEQDKTKAQSLLDQAGRIVSNGKTEDDRHFVKVGIGRHYLERADALLALKRPKLALTQLDAADEVLEPNQPRRRAYINILRAEAYLQKKQPELDTATYLLADAFTLSKAIRSDYNIGYIERLHTALGQSAYANAPDVRDLGRAIKQWKKIQNHQQT